ncbi:UNVERIFIED_CONTAM: hypothetical protein H355_012986 [Colinus virginianus]|nr:hypothetical protein H355_012986 [Colinus virginianus]
MSEEAVTEARFSLKTVALQAFHLPVSWYHSLTQVQSATSCHSCACANSNSWDKADEEDMKLVNIPVTTPENLYLMGMELFEEALRRWEQALTFRNRQVEDEASCSSIKLGAGDAIAEESVEVSIFNLLLLS